MANITNDVIIHGILVLCLSLISLIYSFYWITLGEISLKNKKLIDNNMELSNINNNNSNNDSNTTVGESIIINKIIIKKSFYYYVRRMVLLPPISQLLSFTIIISTNEISQALSTIFGYTASYTIFLIAAFFTHRLFVALSKSLGFNMPLYHGVSVIIGAIFLTISMILSIYFQIILDREWPDCIYFVGASISAMYWFVIIRLLLCHLHSSLQNINQSTLKNQVFQTKIRTINRSVNGATILVIIFVPIMLWRAYDRFSDQDTTFFQHKEIDDSYISISFSIGIFISSLVGTYLGSTMY